MNQSSAAPAASPALPDPSGRRGTLVVRAVLALGIGMLVLLGWSATASAASGSSATPTEAPPATGLVSGLVAEGGLLDPVLDLVTPVDPGAPSLRTPVDDVAATVDPLVAPVAPVVQPTIDRVEAMVVPAVAPVLEPVRTAVAPVVLPVATPVAEALAPVTAELPTLTAPATTPIASVLPPIDLDLDLGATDIGRGPAAPTLPSAAAATTTSSDRDDAAAPTASSVAVPSGVLLASSPGPVGAPLTALDGAPSTRTPAETRAPSPSPAPTVPAAPAVPACNGPTAPTTMTGPMAVVDGAGLRICLPGEADLPVLTHRLGSLPSAEPDVAPD